MSAISVTVNVTVYWPELLKITVGVEEAASSIVKVLGETVQPHLQVALVQATGAVGSAGVEKNLILASVNFTFSA